MFRKNGRNSRKTQAICFLEFLKHQVTLPSPVFYIFELNKTKLARADLNRLM